MIIPLSDVQKQVLLRRWSELQYKQQEFLEARGVFNDIVLTAGGEGAQFAMKNGVPELTVPE